MSETRAGTGMHLHGRHIFSREAISGITNQHARLSHRPIPHNDALDWTTTRHVLSLDLS